MVRQVLAAVAFVVVAVGGVLAQDGGESAGVPREDGAVQAVEPLEAEHGVEQVTEQPVPLLEPVVEEVVAPEPAAGEVVEPVPAVAPVVEPAPAVVERPVVPEPVVEQVSAPEPVQPQPDQPEPQAAQPVVKPKRDGGMLAKNCVTLDFSPYIFSALLGQAGKIALDSSMSFGSSGSGIALQYERHLHRRVSLAARFDYLGVNLNLGMKHSVENGFDIDPEIDFILEDAVINTEAEFKFTIYNYDIHFRCYPFGEAFFLGGIFGYASVALNAGGKLVLESDVIDVIDDGEFEIKNMKEAVELNYSPSIGSIKIGPTLGWRNTVMRVKGGGGLVVELSLSYLLGISQGKPLLLQMKDEGFDIDSMDKSIRDAFDIAEKYWLTGGPRVTVAAGWRF